MKLILLLLFSFGLLARCDRETSKLEQNFLDFYQGYLQIESPIQFNCLDDPVNPQKYNLVFEAISMLVQADGLITGRRQAEMLHKEFREVILTYRSCGMSWFPSEKEANGKFIDFWNTLIRPTGMSPEKNSEYSSVAKAIEEGVKSSKESLEKAINSKNHKELGKEMRNLVDLLAKKIDVQSGGKLGERRKMAGMRTDESQEGIFGGPSQRMRNPQGDQMREIPEPKKRGPAPGIGAGKRLKVQKEDKEL